MNPETNRSIFRTVAILGTLALGFWASSAVAQLAPWQQPPGSSPGPAAAKLDQASFDPKRPSADDGNLASPETPGRDAPNHSTPWANEDYEKDGGPLGLGRGFFPNLTYRLVHDRLWVRSEFLGWWTKGFATPPLLTTSPTGTDPTQAGVLGAIGTSVLFGGKDLQGGFHPGERIAVGAWFDGCQTLGVEASYLQLSRQTGFFNTSDVSTPILARPFFNSQTGQQDSQIVAYPGRQNGTFSSAAASELQAAEFLFRKNLFRQTGLAIDAMVGYRYQQLNDHLAVDDTLTFSGTQSGFPAGSTVQQSDRFDAWNVFHGANLGISTALHLERWTIDTVLKVGVGNTHSRVAIEGATATSIPGQTATLLPGGLLALPSNMGVFNSNQFSVVPELGVTLGFDFSPQLRATVGYDVIYWNNVARPGDQIDSNIDPRQFPPPAITNASRPEFTLHTSDYWAQGLNLGLDLRF